MIKKAIKSLSLSLKQSHPFLSESKACIPNYAGIPFKYADYLIHNPYFILSIAWSSHKCTENYSNNSKDSMKYNQKIVTNDIFRTTMERVILKLSVVMNTVMNKSHGLIISPPIERS